MKSSPLEESSEGGKKSKSSGLGLQALILTPTRELAIQIKDHIQSCSRHTPIKTAVIVGGLSQAKQERLLERRPEILVATPGRLLQLIDEVYCTLLSSDSIFQEFIVFFSIRAMNTWSIVLARFDILS